MEILCIDDESGVVELIELIMQRENIAVIGAVSGVEGLNIMRQRLPNAVLLDIMMPDIDGWEVFRQIKDDPQLSDISIIILTARDMPLEEIVARERAGLMTISPNHLHLLGYMKVSRKPSLAFRAIGLNSGSIKNFVANTETRRVNGQSGKVAVALPKRSQLG